MEMIMKLMMMILIFEYDETQLLFTATSSTAPATVPPVHPSRTKPRGECPKNWLFGNLGPKVKIKLKRFVINVNIFEMIKF